MALVKVKPTSPGRRAVVKVVNPNLHKGRPFAALVEAQSKNAARNNNTHITTLHQRGAVVMFATGCVGVPMVTSIDSGLH